MLIHRIKYPPNTEKINLRPPPSPIQARLRPPIQARLHPPIQARLR